MSKKSAREQAGKELLAAIDAYIYAVSAAQAEERTLAMNKRLHKYAEEFRQMLSRPPEGKPGPYERALRESINSHSPF